AAVFRRFSRGSEARSFASDHVTSPLLCHSDRSGGPDLRV
ncbi:MAG: hypothetical protein AVDCRST_MAG42-1388, partial [uncultured Chthoniobacterales bacterium]